MLQKEENEINEIIEIKTIEIDNIDNGTIDSKRIKSSTDEGKEVKGKADRKIIKQKDNFLKVGTKEEQQNYAEDVVYLQSWGKYLEQNRQIQ